LQLRTAFVDIIASIYAAFDVMVVEAAPPLWFIQTASYPIKDFYELY
jgi:hypothetical protein